MKHGSRILVPIVVSILAVCGAAAQELRVMSSDYQEARPQIRMRLSAPPEAGALVLRGFEGEEAISSLYSFRLDLVAGNDRQIPIDGLLGKPIVVSIDMPDGGSRHFGGICNRFTQGDRSLVTRYTMEIVPSFWLLTKRQSSRIFQEMSVPRIVDQLLEGVPGLVFEWRLAGTYHERDYTVQYRESDFDFASRLLEEEGIYYFFKHSEEGHTLVLADTPESHPDLPGALRYAQDADAGADSIVSWEKTQEIRSGKVTLRDHTFELPDRNLEVMATIQQSVQAGLVVHRLAAGGGENFEIYDYPGEYAQRFDGIDKGGAERPGELDKILPDGQRTAEIRMQEEAARALVIGGASGAPILAPGHRFVLTGHFDGDGPYVLTSVHHVARAPVGRTGGEYSNSFECIPAGLPFRPARTTPKPVIPGTQTAVVVGPAGEEIFTDKYGRVKVRFHWDREGQGDDGGSCWVRVGALNAGNETGSVQIPRIGLEVVVSFLEGDPDQPIITGSVYNAGHLPPPAMDR